MIMDQKLGILDIGFSFLVSLVVVSSIGLAFPLIRPADTETTRETKREVFERAGVSGLSVESHPIFKRL